MKNFNITKIYNLIGQALCATAGAIIGFLTAGLALAVLGIFLGVFAAHALQNSLLTPKSK